MENLEISSCRTGDSAGYDRVWAQIDMDAVLGLSLIALTIYVVGMIFNALEHGDAVRGEIDNLWSVSFRHKKSSPFRSFLISL